MAAETENGVLADLRRIRFTLDRVEAGIGGLKLRAFSIEHCLGEMQMQVAGLNGRMNRFDERLTRMERRLELVRA